MLFESSAVAWHDAFDVREGVQDPFAQKVRGTKMGDEGVREAELSKVKKVINGLSDKQRVAGMWCFGPSAMSGITTYRDKLMQRAWGACLSNKQKRIGNYLLTVKLTILVNRAVEDARFRSVNPDKSGLYSQAQLASALGISAPAYIESWKSDYEVMIASILNDALDGLTEVEKEVNSINARYRQAS